MVLVPSSRPLDDRRREPPIPHAKARPDPAPLLHHIANDIADDLRRHLELLVLRPGGWHLSARLFERMLKTAAYEASGAAELDPYA